MRFSWASQPDAASVRGSLRHAPQLAEPHELVEHLHRRVEAALLGQVTESAARCEVDRATVPADLAGVERGQAEDGPHGGRLAGTVRAEESGDGPRLHVERHAIERSDGAIGAHEALDLQHAEPRYRTVLLMATWTDVTVRHDRRGAARSDRRDDTRKDVVERLLALLVEGDERGCELVVFPELALTTFFPRWFVEDITEFDHFYETAMPGPDTQPLFDEARRRGVGFCLGYAELTDPDASGTRHRYNTQLLVERDGSIVARYRKVHLPGHEAHEPDRPFQHAERYFFEPGPDGFGVWPAFGGLVGMMICNDRRWPESYRVMGLQGVELILCGYNTPIHYAPDPSQDPLQGFHNALVMQSGAYQNGTWVVGVAKGGVEEGVDSLAQSMIIAPSGQIVAQALSSDDELVAARCDLDWCARYKGTVFDFDRYRRPEMYGRITEQRGVIRPT